MADETSNNSRLTNEQVGVAFRALAEEYVEQGQAGNEAVWANIEALGAGEVRTPGLRLAPPRPSRVGLTLGGWSLVGAATALAAAVLLAWGLGAFNGSEELRYSVDGVAMTGASSNNAEGELVASEELPVLLTFSDETRVIMQPHTTLRVQVDRELGTVHVRLAQGKVDIKSSAAAVQYVIHAGTFRLDAKGAAFSFGYVPPDKQIDLVTSAGVVVVSEKRGVAHRVEEGQELHLPKREISAHEVQATQLAIKQTDHAQTLALPKSNSVGGERATQPTFAQLAAVGKFSEIVSRAKRQGITATLASASASELQELGQAARYTGDLALASLTWTHMTLRFSGAPARNAQFFLGRLAEQEGNMSRALGHYDTYLMGGGGGVYSPEALGRKLSLVHKSQGVQKARPIAHEYLRKFPHGPYARMAGELVGDE